MNMHFPTSPIIVIGMHRSGTTLLTKILENCDVYWGRNKDEYNEAKEFQLLNEQLFSNANGKWDNPGPVEEYLSDTQRSEMEASNLRLTLDTQFFENFFDHHPPFQNGPAPVVPVQWGWKDPRNIFTLPVWLDVFPNARLVHIIRNGVDVTASLWRRETSRPEGVNHPHYSALCQSLMGCFRLWKHHVTSARNQVNRHKNALEVSFEALIEQPAMTVRGLLGFLGLEVSDPLDIATSLIKPERSLAFINAPKLHDFWHQIKNDSLMNELGYSGLMK
jgi:hypothetical protein